MSRLLFINGVSGTDTASIIRFTVCSDPSLSVVRLRRKAYVGRCDSFDIRYYPVVRRVGSLARRDLLSSGIFLSIPTRTELAIIRLISQYGNRYTQGEHSPSYTYYGYTQVPTC